MLTALLALNALLSSGALVYLLRVEHRFTKLETYMRVVLRQLHLLEENES